MSVVPVPKRTKKSQFLAALNYVLLHKKQLSAAIAFGAAVLEAFQKAT